MKVHKSGQGQPSHLAKELGMQRPFELLEREVFLNLARTSAMMSEQVQTLLKEHDLSAPQYNALRVLRGHGTAVSVYQIGEQMITRQPDMPRLIEKLEAKGLAAKRRCENDRRVVWVTLTRQGRALLKKIDAPLDKMHREQFAHLTRSQQKQLNDLLWLARHPEGQAS